MMSCRTTALSSAGAIKGTDRRATSAACFQAGAMSMVTALSTWMTLFSGRSVPQVLTMIRTRKCVNHWTSIGMVTSTWRISLGSKLRSAVYSVKPTLTVTTGFSATAPRSATRKMVASRRMIPARLIQSATRIPTPVSSSPRTTMIARMPLISVTVVSLSATKGPAPMARMNPISATSRGTRRSERTSGSATKRLVTGT